MSTAGCPEAEVRFGASRNGAGGWKARPRLRNAKLSVLPPKIRVIVHKLSGASAHMSVRQDMRVGELKCHLDDAWQIPPECQMLLLGSRLLEDSDKICSMLDELSVKGVISITMLFSTFRLRADLADEAELTDETSQRKLVALRCYAKMGRKSSNDDIAAVAATLEYRDPCVRRAAIDALVAMTSPDNDYAIKVVAARLEHDQASIRVAAVCALKQIGQLGHPFVLSSLVARLDDDSSKVRYNVVRALSHTLQDNDGLLDIIMDRLQHSSPRHRIEALVLVGKVSGSCLGRSHPDSLVAAVVGCFDDPEPTVRSTAVPVLVAMAANGLECIAYVTQHMWGKSRLMQRSANFFLRRLAMRGDERVVTALRHRLEQSLSAQDEHKGAIVTALETTIHALVDSERQSSVSHLSLCRWASELMACLASPQPRLTCAAVYGLGAVLEKFQGMCGRPGVEILVIGPETMAEQRPGVEVAIIQALVAQLRSPHVPIVLRAMTALVDNDVCGVHDLVELLRHSCPEVSAKASVAMRGIELQRNTRGKEN